MDSANQQPQHINLAIGGAGVCGASEAGAAVALIEAGYIADNVCGTSAGSMLGAVIAARMPTDQIRETTVNLSYPSFQDPANRVVSWLVRIPVVGQWVTWNFLGGAYKLDKLRATVDSFLTPLGSATWADHEARVARGEAANLNVVSFNLNEGELAVFPRTYEEELGIPRGDRLISEAISASVAVPTFFRPPRIPDSMGRDWVFSDGGTIKDVPFDVAQQMNPGLRTIAISMNHVRGYTPYPKWGWLLGIKLLLRILTTAGSAVEEASQERPDITANTITVPTLGIDPNNFGLTAQQAAALFDAGYQAGKEWVARDIAARQPQQPAAPTVVPDRGLAA